MNACTHAHTHTRTRAHICRHTRTQALDGKSQWSVHNALESTVNIQILALQGIGYVFHLLHPENGQKLLTIL